MSGFWGEVSLKSGDSDPKNWKKMKEAIAAWGSDASGFWQEGAIALGSRLRYIVPEDAFDVQPLVTDSLVLVGRIRLDDRSSLARTLAIDPADLARLPDSQLLLRAWQQWGEGCVEYLYGDWACAIWNRRQQSLWLGRDASGNSGIYYWYDSQRLVFSNNLKALLAHRAIPKQPNPYHIARQLTVAIDPTQEMAIAYADILRLPVGQAMRCYGSKVEPPYIWWQPELLPELDWSETEDYDAAFRELYSAAVKARLRKASGSIGLMMSSGLDSGSVAALAAPELAAQGDRLLAYTSVPYFKTDGASSRRLGDETSLARATAEHIGNIDFIPVPCASSSIVAAIETLLEIHDRPGHAAVNYYWMLDILNIARSMGVAVALTGQGGNATVSWRGIGNLLPHIWKGDWGLALSSCRHSHLGFWLAAKQQIVKPLLQEPLNNFRRWRKLGQAPWKNSSAISRKLIAQSELYERMQVAGQSWFASDTCDDRDPRIARFRLGRLGGVGEIWMENAEAYQMDVRDPTRDRKLTEFCWQVPDAVFWADGLGRGLIRRGMTDLLPDAVLKSQRKGLQAADIGYRVRAQGREISASLDKIEAHSLAQEWLDVPKMRSVLAGLESDITPTKTAMTSSVLLRGLCVGMFLARF